MLDRGSLGTSCGLLVIMQRSPAGWHSISADTTALPLAVTISDWPISNDFTLITSVKSHSIDKSIISCCLLMTSLHSPLHLSQVGPIPEIIIICTAMVWWLSQEINSNNISSILSLVKIVSLVVYVQVCNSAVWPLGDLRGYGCSTLAAWHPSSFNLF